MDDGDQAIPRTAHPHSRGENRGQIRITWKTTGSSPLTRGKQRRNGPDPCRRGLIPTHAGKTPGHNHARKALRAHPHSRGENRKAARRARSRSGSSPLTRGKQDASHRLGIFHGLIPTHAGKTRTRTSSTCLSRAHPHSRGENLGRSGRGKTTLGSSPLTRGKRVDCPASRDVRGLIPTHAGKTRPRQGARWRARAHPHSRGENPWWIAESS